MNSYERLFNRLEGKVVDRLPNLNMLMSFAAKFANIPYSVFCQDSKSMVEANILCHEKFGIDAVTTMSDPYAETSDFGAEIEYPFDDNPVCRVPFIKEYSDIKRIKVKDIGTSDRMYKRLKTLEMYNQNLKGICPIIGWVEGAFGEFVDLRGINEVMADILDEPEFSQEVMEICTEQAILFAKAQIKAGADIIGVGDAAASLVGERLYKEMIFPYEKRIIEEIHRAGGKAKLHICGNTLHLLEHICETGTDIFDLDWMVDLRAAYSTSRGRVSISGNYDPVGVLMRGSKEVVRNAVIECVRIGDNKNIISAGCEVPHNTPAENLLTVNRTLIEMAELSLVGENYPVKTLNYKECQL